MTRILGQPAEQFLAQVRDAGLPEPEREYKFHPTRKFLFDFCWPEYRLAVEIDGGVLSNKRGGHNSIKGITRDMEKINLAQLLGWRVLRFHTQNLNDDEAIPMVIQLLEAEAR